MSWLVQERKDRVILINLFGAVVLGSLNPKVLRYLNEFLLR